MKSKTAPKRIEEVRITFRDLREYELNLKFQMPRLYKKYQKALEEICRL